MELWHLPLLFLGGLACGIINAMAGGGSFVTLPLLLWMGLPPQVANATNRVAILLQTGAGIATYHQAGVRPWRKLPPVALPTAAGALLGAWLAAHLDPDSFRKAMAVLFLIMAATVFFKPSRWSMPSGEERFKPYHYVIFFFLGIYGGFLQAGLGILLTAMFVLVAGFDVVRGNAMKFGLAFIFTGVSLLLFSQAGLVRWLTGLALAAGTITGGIIGAKLVIARGATWVRFFVAGSALAAVAKLLLQP
jgi:uncharacterized protein